MGASDNLVRGQSTFMVEMSETSAILHTATARSLVLLDEIGRGTATYDGVSIAWAVTEHLHERVGCKTVFATHYHELTQLPRNSTHCGTTTSRCARSAIRSCSCTGCSRAARTGRTASRSDGWPGLPQPVIARAEMLAVLEGEHLAAKRGERDGARRPTDQLGCSARRIPSWKLGRST